MDDKIPDHRVLKRKTIAEEEEGVEAVPEEFVNAAATAVLAESESELEEIALPLTQRPSKKNKKETSPTAAPGTRRTTNLNYKQRTEQTTHLIDLL